MIAASKDPGNTFFLAPAMFMRAAVFVTALCVAHPQPARAQTGADLVGGAVLGAVISLPVTLGYSALRAQGGHYMWNSDEAFDRVLVVGGVVVGLSAGMVLVRSDKYSLGDALAGAVVGGGLGALVGRGISQLTSSTPEGRWAGLAIGLGAGTLVGSITATLVRAEDRADTPTTPMASVSVPLDLPLIGR